MGLTNIFESILWEYDLSKLKIDSSVVVERVLNLGDKNVTDFWIKEVGTKRAKELFIKNKNLLDKKSCNYWELIFGLRNNKILTDNKTMYEKLNKPIFSRSFG